VNRKIQNNFTWASGIVAVAIGALTMYFSDPDRGRRRRALVRDQIQHWARQAILGIDVATRDLGNRWQGVRARTRYAARRLVARERPAPDAVVEERVRARLGRATSHPRAIKVVAQQGWINLSGAVLASEKEDVLETVKATAGVAAVADNMQVYESAEHIPSLQGNHEAQRGRSALSPGNWTPATRALAAIGGCTLGCYGLMRRSPANVALATLGFGLMATGVLSNTRSSRRRHDVSAEARKRMATMYERAHERAAVHEQPQEAGKAAQTARDAETAVQQQPTSPQPGSLLH
jgi:hypothetical protein